MKKIYIFLFNILIILLLFFLLDFFVYSSKANYITYFQNLTKKIAVSPSDDKRYLENFYIEQMRKPRNINSNLGSIIVVGCSFVYGSGLNEDETITYKISELLDNPVYNFGFISKAINTFITFIEVGLLEEIVKTPPKIVIYNYGDFHIQRLVMPNLFYEDNEFLYYIKNYKLERKRPPFFVSRSIVLSLIREKIFLFFQSNSLKYREYLKLLLKMHFLEMKKIIDSKYKDVKYIIIVYFDAPIFEEISQDLEKEGFVILRNREGDLGVDVSDETYQLPDGHPSAKAWETVVPHLVNTLKLYL